MDRNNSNAVTAAVVLRYFMAVLLCTMAAHAYAQQKYITPGENLILEGIPPVPEEIVKEVEKYTESRSTGFRAWHPQRMEMIVTTRASNTSQLFSLQESMGKLTQLTDEEEPVRSAVYEPVNGDYFIFLKDTGGDEFTHLYKCNSDGSGVTPLTSGARVQNGFPVWNNKGDIIAFTSTRRNGTDRDIYVMNPLDSNTTKLVLECSGGGWGVSDWSPGDSLLLVSNFVSRTESYYYLLNFNDGTLNEVTPTGSDNAFFSQGEFDAAGKGIYLVTDMNGNFRRIAYLDLQSRSVDYLSDDIPWDVSEIEITTAGDKLAYTTNEAGESHLYMIYLPSGKPVKLGVLPGGVAGNLSFHNNGNDLALSLNWARSSTDVYVLNAISGNLRQWTESATVSGGSDSLSLPSLIKWESFDGLEISGFLYPPPKRFEGKRPVIINIHGGPESQSRPDYIGFNNYYLNELGIAMIYPNVRGSTGFGKEFMELDNGYNRENSVKDIGALLDWIALQPELDADRVMVTGGSYGGYMALAVSVHYTDRIKCAVDVVGISNFNTFLRNTESYRRDLRRVEYGDERDPDMYNFLESISPLNNAHRIRNPLLIIQGSNDPRVPRTEAEQMKEVIQKNGGTVWYLEAKDEGHGFSKKTNADFQRYVTVLFTKWHLLN